MSSSPDSRERERGDYISYSMSLSKESSEMSGAVQLTIEDDS